MKISQKREVVLRFKAGESIEILSVDYFRTIKARHIIEKVLRDFMNGKFQLEPRIPYRDRLSTTLKRREAKRQKAKVKYGR